MGENSTRDFPETVLDREQQLKDDIVDLRQEKARTKNPNRFLLLLQEKEVSVETIVRRSMEH